MLVRGRGGGRCGFWGEICVRKIRMNDSSPAIFSLRDILVIGEAVLCNGRAVSLRLSSDADVV